jgi:hypothetical protein
VDDMSTKLAEHEGGIYSSASNSSTLRILCYLPVPITSASFFASKLCAATSTQTLPRPRFVVVSYGGERRRNSTITRPSPTHPNPQT